MKSHPKANAFSEMRRPSPTEVGKDREIQDTCWLILHFEKANKLLTDVKRQRQGCPHNPLLPHPHPLIDKMLGDVNKIGEALSYPAEGNNSLNKTLSEWI